MLKGGVFFADIPEMPDILDFFVSVVFLNDLDNLDASLSRFFQSGD